MFRSREILRAPVTDERESRGVTRVKHACLAKKKAAGDEGDKPTGRAGNDGESKLFFSSKIFFNLKEV
jgi:hypothetical protein